MEGVWLCIQWFICLGVTIALAILGGWHLYLISVSETTIEFYTNKRDARNMKSQGEVRRGAWEGGGGGTEEEGRRVGSRY